MSKMKQIAALTAMLVGVIMYASPAKSAVCFLPDDDGSCGGGDIEISDDSTSENQCADFNLSQNQRNSKEYDSDCYSCEPCTYNSRTTYKCALKNGATWYGGNLSVCCTNGEKYDSAEGKCCPAEGCVHNCPEGQSWDSSAKSCKCDNGKDANGGICCADSEHVSDGICCPEKKHNEGGTCVCDSEYNTDENGNCVLGSYECPEGYTENKPSSVYEYEIKNVGSKVCYKIIDGNWPKTIRVKLWTEYYVSEGKYIHKITKTNLTFANKDGTVVSSNSFKDEGLSKFKYLYKDKGDDVMKLDYVYDTENNDMDNVGGFYFLRDPKALFLEFDEGGFYFKDFVLNSDVQDVQEWKPDLFLRFGSSEWQETSQQTNPLSFKGDISLGYGQRVKENLDLQLDVTVYSTKISAPKKCQDIDKTYIETSSIKDNDPEDICPYLYSPVFGYVKNLGNGKTDLKIGFEFGGGDNAEFVDTSVVGCTACRWKTCEEIDSDFGNSSLDCLPGYDATPLSYNWAVGSDGRCYECVKQKTIIEFEYYVPSVDGAGDYCSDGLNWSGPDGNFHWNSSYMCPDPECVEEHKAEWEAGLYASEYAYDFNYNDFVLPFDMEIVTKYKVPYVYRGIDCRDKPTTSWPSKFVDPIYEPKTVTLTIPKGSKLNSQFKAKALDYSGNDAVIERKFYIDGVERETYTIGDITYKFQEI